MGCALGRWVLVDKLAQNPISAIWFLHLLRFAGLVIIYLGGSFVKKSKAIAILIVVYVSLILFNLPTNNYAGSTHCFGKCGVVDTGQITGYTSTYGEDNDYVPAGTQMSYTVNPNNTITDDRTGLMWRRCNQGKNDDATCTGTASTLTWEQALSSCEDETADYSDWRLPNIKELFSLTVYEGASPFLNTTYFPNPGGTYFWTSTTYMLDTTNYAMQVRFNEGTVRESSKVGTAYVLCVRAGS